MFIDIVSPSPHNNLYIFILAIVFGTISGCGISACDMYLELINPQEEDSE
jgi:hypothetical protein